MTTPYHFLPTLASQLTEIPPDSIVSRTVHSDDRLKVILFGFAAGQELSEHTAARPAVLHFLAGEATLTLGADRFEVGPGAWAHMPPHLLHSILAHSEVTMLLLML